MSLTVPLLENCPASMQRFAIKQFLGSSAVCASTRVPTRAGWTISPVHEALRVDIHRRPTNHTREIADKSASGVWRNRPVQEDP